MVHNLRFLTVFLVLISGVHSQSLTQAPIDDTQHRKNFGTNNFLQDDKRLAAEKLSAEAESLRKQNTPESRKEAIKKYYEALKLWREIGDENKQADTLKLLTEVSFYNSDIPNALKYAQEALPIYQKLGDRALEAEMLNNIGGFYDALGETRAGIVYAKKSVEILQNLNDKKREAIALNGLGMFYSNIGEMQPAIETLQSALELRRAVKDRSGEARTLVNLGTIYDDTGEKRKAAEFYEKAIAIALEEKDVRTYSTALNNSGLVWHDLGEYQKALDVYQKALELRRQSGNKSGEATSLNNIGAVYKTLGEFEEALKMLEQSLKIYQESGFRRNEAKNLSSIGTIYSELGDAQKALEFYQKALTIHRELENKEGQLSVLHNIGLIYAGQDQPQKAMELFRKALQFAEEISDRESEGEILTARAQAFERLGDAENAGVYYNRALSLQRDLGLQGDVAETLYHFAQFEERNGNSAAAIEKMREVLQLSEDLRNSITNQNLRSSYFATLQSYFDFYISLLIAAHRLEPKKGFDALALEISEQTRARSLLESLGESQADIRSGIEPSLLAREKLLRQTINAKETQRLNAVRQTDSIKAAEYEKDIGELVKKYRDLQTEIRAKSPQFAALTQPESLTLKEIQTQILDDNTILLEYFLGAKKSFLFLVTRGSLEIFELPPQPVIEKKARSFIENLRARASENLRESQPERETRIQFADRNWRKEAANLSEMLLAPVAAKLQNKRLLVVNSGILQYVSFASLFNPAAKNQYLVETNEILHLPSASTLAILRNVRKNRQNKPKNTAAVLADPVFEIDDARVKTLAKKPAIKTDNSGANLVSSKLRSNFSRLRFSRQEAETISALLPNEKKLIAIDFSANLKTVDAEDFTKSRIVHFATHGIVNSEFPELSGVVLSLVNENGEWQDGFLRLHDIYNLLLAADLVVLSACETALGKEIKGEGIVGLTRGFMYAGNSDVVASLWKVDDRATTELMKRFYQKMLKEKLRPADALRKAQISMIKEKETQNPFYWAAFILQGDWK